MCENKFQTYWGSNSDNLANFCNEPRSTRNLFLSKKEENSGSEGFRIKMDAGSGTVEQYWLREQASFQQHSGSSQSIRPSKDHITHYLHNHVIPHLHHCQVYLSHLEWKIVVDGPIARLVTNVSCCWKINEYYILPCQLYFFVWNKIDVSTLYCFKTYKNI